MHHSRPTHMCIISEAMVDTEHLIIYDMCVVKYIYKKLNSKRVKKSYEKKN